MDRKRIIRKFNEWMWNHQTRIPVWLWNYWVRHSSFPGEKALAKEVETFYEPETLSKVITDEIRKQFKRAENPWPDAKHVEFRKFNPLQAKPAESEHEGFSKLPREEESEYPSPEEEREIWDGILQEVVYPDMAQSAAPTCEEERETLKEIVKDHKEECREWLDKLRAKQAEERQERLKAQAREHYAGFPDGEPMPSYVGEIDDQYLSDEYEPCYFADIEALKDVAAYGSDIGVKMEIIIYKDKDGNAPSLGSLAEKLNPMTAKIFTADNPFM